MTTDTKIKEWAEQLSAATSNLDPPQQRTAQYTHQADRRDSKACHHRPVRRHCWSLRGTVEERLTEDAIQRLCHKVHFCSSPESAKAWMDGRPGFFSVTVDEAFELGRVAKSPHGPRHRNTRMRRLVNITVQYFAGCRNCEATAAHVSTFAREGQEATMSYELIDAPELAVTRRFRGSPAVLIEGVDPFADETGTGRAGLSGLPNRRRVGPPSLSQLRHAITTAQKE